MRNSGSRTSGHPSSRIWLILWELLWTLVGVVGIRLLLFNCGFFYFFIFFISWAASFTVKKKKSKRCLEMERHGGEGEGKEVMCNTFGCCLVWPWETAALLRHFGAKVYLHTGEGFRMSWGISWELKSPRGSLPLFCIMNVKKSTRDDPINLLFGLWDTAREAEVNTSPGMPFSRQVWCYIFFLLLQCNVFKAD